MIFRPYRRLNAVLYAHHWAYGRNPRFYDYEELGGDCTNFASQCVYAGAGVMNYTPVYGWYYIDPDNKAPAWTGVEYFYSFLTRPQISLGPVARETDDLRLAQPGDVIQLRFSGPVFQHSPVVVQTSPDGSADRILLAAHSSDADWRPLSSYEYEAYRVLHILGFYDE